MKKRQQGLPLHSAVLPSAYFTTWIGKIKNDFVADFRAGQVGCRFGGSLHL